LLHHALAKRADLEHVRRHDPVALLRYPLDLIQATHRLHAETEKYHIERLRHFEQLANMLGEFAVGAVNAIAGLAAQLDLAAGLERNLCLVAAERDNVAVLLLGLPTEALDQFPENPMDPARPRVRNRLAGCPVDADFFVLRADPPLLARFTGVVKVRFEL